MDMIYFEKPIFLLFPILLSFWQIFVYFLKKKRQVSSFLNILLTSISVVGHAVAISVILLNDGTLSDALLLVLVSGALSLILSQKPNESTKEIEE